MVVQIWLVSFQDVASALALAVRLTDTLMWQTGYLWWTD